MREVGFGIIGCGLMGREFASAAARWCHLLSPSARPRLVAVSDVNAAATQWFTDNFPEIQASADYKTLLTNPEVEAVYCAVPHNLHDTIYRDVLTAGKHLFAEKPFGIDLPAAQAIYSELKARANQLVRCSSEFPFFPGAQKLIQLHQEGFYGNVFEIKAGFLHSSDLDPTKPMNWKRRIATNGEYGCMGDLGLHVLHVPLRLRFQPKNVRALLSKVVNQRPGDSGALEQVETWENAILACETTQGIPMVLETKRVSPGDANTWYLSIQGDRGSATFTTKNPKVVRTLAFEKGKPQAWQEEDLGHKTLFPTITGAIFEFGFPDAILQMWAAYLEELNGVKPVVGCATPEEALASHALFTAALESQNTGQTIEVRDWRT